MMAHQHMKDHFSALNVLSKSNWASVEKQKRIDDRPKSALSMLPVIGQRPDGEDLDLDPSDQL